MTLFCRANLIAAAFFALLAWLAHPGHPRRSWEMFGLTALRRRNGQNSAIR